MEKFTALEQNCDFSKCFFCQSNAIDDAKFTNPNEQGYVSLSTDVARYIEFDANILPSHVSDLFENVTQFKELCKQSRVVYHKSCRNEYNSQRLNRLQISYKQTQKCEDHVDICVFCKQPGQLSTVSSKDTLAKIIHQAELTNDHFLMQKLFDMPELSTIKYHKSCYITHFKTRNSAPIEKFQIDLHSYYNVLLQKMIDRIEKTRHSPEQEFFKLSQLAKTMSDGLSQMGFDNIAHSSRLKDQLLSAILGLRAEKIGREIFLFFDDNVKELVANAIESDKNDDDTTLDKAVDILRRQLNAERTVSFSGSLNKTFCAEKTVSKKLVNFFSSLLEGRESCSKITEKIAEIIAQIVLFNCVKRRKNDVSYARHNIDREQPLNIYLGLMIHSETGQRKLVDELNDMGLSISYSRVLDIERVLAVKVCEKYVQDDCICPPSLTEGIFTTAAIDNIDHNPTSSSANYSFHGTGISLIQHFDNQHNEDSKQSIILEKSDFSNKRKPCLPDSYYNIPLVPSIAGELPVSTVNWDCDMDDTGNPLEYTKNWLENCSKSMEHESSYDNVLSWGAFNSRFSMDKSKFKSNSAMLPLLKDDINSPAVVMHAMDIVIAATRKLNPTQTPVNTADEPVYAIAKQLQWLYPDKYGEDKIVLVLGKYYSIISHCNFSIKV